MKNLVESFNEQLKHAIRIGEASALTFSGKPVANVVIAGMGGSGIGGNLVQAAVQNAIQVPVVVSKSYNIPAFVNENTLFIASSFSGNTEETLSAVKQALQKNAQVTCVTSGGELAQIAKQHNLPHILIPGESGAPRACLGYSLVQLLFTLNKAGLINSDFKTGITEGISLIEDQADDIKDRARSIAQALFNHLPVLYASPAFEAVAVRSQQQINENAKQLCHVNMFSEMNHNEIVGWVNPDKILKEVVVVLLRSSFDHERIKRRMELCKPIFQEKANHVLELEAKGKTQLAQMFYFIHTFDWVSLFLADLNGVDPNPVKVIDHLKNALAEA